MIVVDWKRMEKEVLDPSGEKTKTGSTPNKKRNTRTRSSSTIQNTASVASQAVNVPAKVRRKKPESKIDNLFVYPLSHKITANLSAYYEEIDALPEPFIELQHCTTSFIHDTFRAIAAVPSFTILVFNTATSQLHVPRQSVSCP